MCKKKKRRSIKDAGQKKTRQLKLSKPDNTEPSEL